MTKKKYEKPDFILNIFFCNQQFLTILKYFYYFETILLTPQIIGYVALRELVAK
jgi:hypothetical protein